MEIVKSICKKIGMWGLILVIGSLIGLLALLLVHCIPIPKIEAHVRDSITMLERDFVAGNAVEGYPGSMVGSFTDSLMLQYAIYSSEEHSLPEQVFYMYRGEVSTGEGWAPGYSLIAYLSGQEMAQELEYSRYWHGYLVVLKPLLYLMSFNSLRMLASCVQLGLVGVILMLCFYKKEYFLGIGFLAALPFLYFANLYLSLSLSICFYLLAIITILQLIGNDRLCRSGRYAEFFLIAGMATAYFDFLTYPLVTLAFPLCIWLCFNGHSWKDNLKKIAYYSIAWFAGYIGFWAMKWILTDLFAGGTTILDAFSTITQRTGNASGQNKAMGFLTVIYRNLLPYTNWAFYLTALVIVGFMAMALIKRGILAGKQRHKLSKDTWGSALSVLLIAFYPFAWFFLTQNHSEEHWQFTCKIFSISVFAFVCAVGKLVKSEPKNSC